MNVFAPDELFRLDSFQHAELFSGSSQVREALALRPEYVRTVLRLGIRGDVAEGAHFIGGARIAYLRGNLCHPVPAVRLARTLDFPGRGRPAPPRPAGNNRTAWGSAPQCY